MRQKTFGILICIAFVVGNGLVPQRIYAQLGMSKIPVETVGTPTIGKLFPKGGPKTVNVDFWLVAEPDKTGKANSQVGYVHWSIKPEGDDVVFHSERLTKRKTHGRETLDYERLRFVTSADGHPKSFDRYLYMRVGDQQHTAALHGKAQPGGRYMINKSPLVESDRYFISGPFDHPNSVNETCLRKAGKVSLKDIEAELARRCEPLKLAYHIRKGNRTLAEREEGPNRSENHYHVRGAKTIEIDGKKVTVHTVTRRTLLFILGGIEAPKFPYKPSTLESRTYEILGDGHMIGLRVKYDNSLGTFRRGTKEQAIKAVGEKRIEPLQKGAADDDKKTDSPKPKKPVDEGALKKDAPVKQKVLFHFSYENFAWGHQKSGWYIDGQGNVWIMKDLAPWDDDEKDLKTKDGVARKTMVYDKDRIEKGYEKVRGKRVMTIDKKTLSTYVELIRSAAKGAMSEKTDNARDAGTTIYGCLYYDEKQKKYRKITLLQDGDFKSVNKADGAKKIVTWLKTIRGKAR